MKKCEVYDKDSLYHFIFTAILSLRKSFPLHIIQADDIKCTLAETGYFAKCAEIYILQNFRSAHAKDFKAHVVMEAI